MNRDEVVRVIINFLSDQFPIDCKCCGKKYNSYKEFIKNTTPVGKPVSYDAQKGDWRPENPLGAISMHNCSCGSTIALSSQKIDRDTLWQLMDWAKSESEKRNIELSELLAELRTIVHETVFSD